MLFVDNQKITDPRINLAIEEHLLRDFDVEDDFLLFYINEPSIIIGRNQNTLEEINADYVEKHGIHVVRRLSGGGAVYHDLGNLNFSFITQYAAGNFQNFRKFTDPVVHVLQGLGVDAHLSGRNDILVGERKISGNAQYRSGSRMLSHGTLLLNTDLEQVVAALNVRQGKIASKGLKSVRSRVANIGEFLDHELDIYAFRQLLLEGIFADVTPIPSYVLTEKDWEAIRELSANRYARWEWNFGKSPDFNVQKTHRFPSGEVDVRIDVQNGLICTFKIYGDFFGESDIGELEAHFIGQRYDRASLEAVLQEVDLVPYFGALAVEEFLSLLY